jgi:hypothetical protein
VTVEEGRVEEASGGPAAGVRQLLLTCRGQLHALAPVVLLLHGGTLAILLLAALQTRIPTAFLVRDPAQLAKYPVYVGLLSNVGVLLWCACAAIYLYSATLAGQREVARFFLGAGLVTAMLGLDDFFILHEEVLPATLGVAEEAVLAAYGLAMLAFLGRFARLILRTEFLLLGLTFGFMGGSIVLDGGVFNQGLNYLLDDGLKLLGIVGWLAYYVRTARQFIKPVALATWP